LIGFVVYFTFLGGTFLSEQRAALRIVQHVILAALLAVWLVRWLRGHRPGPTPLDLPLAAYFGWQIVATLFAVDPRISVEWLWTIGVHVLLFYVLVSWNRVGHGRQILFAQYFAAAVVVIMGLFEFVSWYFGIGWLPIFRESWPAIGGLAHPLPPAIYRLSATLEVSTFLSGYLALLIPPALGAILATRSRETRQALGLWVVGAFAVEVLAFSRGGLLSLAVSLPVFVALTLYGRPDLGARVRSLLTDWRFRLLLAVGVLAAVVVGVLWVGRDLTGHLAGDRERFDLWQSAWRTGLADPLTGTGPRGFGRALREYRDPLLTRDDQYTPHNIPLMAWAEGGLPGVIVLAVLWGAALTGAVKRWRGAAEGEKTRVAGALAGLLGYSVHNLFDSFTSTTVMLPALVLVAYLIAPLQPERARVKPWMQVLVPGTLLALLVLAVLGWGVSDAAQVLFEQGIRRADSGDLAGAVESLQAARRLDPGQGFYVLQEAQFLGQAAAHDPALLDQALAAYDTALAFDSSYELVLANRAALLRSSGNLEDAAQAMEAASAAAPHRPIYRLWAGQMEETAGRESLARSAYLDALQDQPGWVLSEFWDGSALRQAVRAEFLVNQSWDTFAGELLPVLDPACWVYLSTSSDYWKTQDPLCAGQFELAQGDAAAALEYLNQAVRRNPGIDLPYAWRARAHYEVGDLTAAELDARTAIFLGGSGLQLASYTLGQVRQAQGRLDEAAEAYLHGGPLIVQAQGYDVAVFNRRGSLAPLPFLDAPWPNRYDLASWSALVDLYEAQGLSQAAQVRDALAAVDPYYFAVTLNSD